MWFWGLPSLKSAGEAGRLETQGKVDVTTQAWRQSGGRIPASLGNLRFSFNAVNWLDYRLYSKATDLNIDHL